MKNIPASFEELLQDETRAFCFLGTLMPDGSPQVTPVWFSTSGDYFLVNTAEGRIKDKNMRARHSVTLCISDPKDPYRYLQIRGKVVERIKEGANAHIDFLSGKYTGNPKYQNYQPGIDRVIYKIEPEKVDAHG